MNNEVLTWSALFISIGAISLALASILFFRFRTANVALIAKLRGEISDAQADIADLRDRFSRFQKREGMRAARAEKENAESLKEQAFRILAEGGNAAGGGLPGEDSKAALYRKFRQ